MLRRIPSTPLVCLVLLLSTIFLNASWAAGPDESLDILLKPNQVSSAPTVVAHKAKSVAYSIQVRGRSRGRLLPTATSDGDHQGQASNVSAFCILRTHVHFAGSTDGAVGNECAGLFRTRAGQDRVAEILSELFLAN